MPKFIKSPKFIIGAIVVLWVAYILYANFQMDPVTFYLLPFKVLELKLRVSAVIIAAAIFGSIVTIVIQFLWSRSSKKASSPAPVVKVSTIA